MPNNGMHPTADTTLVKFFLGVARRVMPGVRPPVWFLWEDEAIWIIGNRKTDSFPGRIATDHAAP
jgi:hypothetical protein